MKNVKARLRRDGLRDALIIFVFFGLLVAWFINIEAFEYVVELSEGHESWELDEFLTAMMILPIALAIYSARRVREYYRELVRRVEAEKQAQAMALHDPLTGLPNRRNINRELDRALARADERPLCILLLDLNRFKAVNDLQGHQAGDQLLVDTSDRLSQRAGPKAIVSRLGGDEFVILIEDAPNGDALLSRIERISESFDEPFVFESGVVAVGASIGVTYIDSSDITAEKAISQADAAMYRCKANGRNGFRFFEAGMETAAIRRAEIEAELRNAIQKDHIEPYYQPLVSLSSGTVMGFEVLARWRLADGTLRMPSEFISIAEETGMIDDLYYSILRQAAGSARYWPTEMYFAVNLSPIQFDDERLVQNTLRILTAAGVAPGRLEVEITENALVADIERAKQVMRAFKKQGVQIALDDFGTGYSSLRHLSELDFDKLKIDRSFIHDIENDESSQTIVRTITSMAHNLGLQVTCEGIETSGNADQVTTFGCDIGQGYLYGRPRPDIRFEIERDDQKKGSGRAA